MEGTVTQGVSSTDDITQQPFKHTIKLLTNKHSVDLYDRHKHAIKRICKLHSNGFYMHDLMDVCRLLNICNERLLEYSDYEEPLYNLITLCSKSFAKKRYSDELTYRDSVVEVIFEIGKSLLQNNAKIRQQACKTLIKFAASNYEDQDNWVTSRNYTDDIIKEAKIPGTSIVALSITEEYDIRCELLDLILKLSSSANNCEEMLLSEAMLHLCTLLNIEDSSKRVLFKAVEILWNLLELGPREKVAEQVNCLTCISELKSALLTLIKTGSSDADRQLRNDLLVIINLIASINPFAPFIETGLAEALMRYTTYPEVPTRNIEVRKFKPTQFVEDFEFKKLLFTFVSKVCVDRAALSLMKKGFVMLGLLSYIRSTDNILPPWSLAQFEELQLLAMSVLTSIAPRLIEDYMVCQANARLLLLLEWCSTNPGTFKGIGNSFHGNFGRGNRKAQLRFGLRLLRSVCSRKENAVVIDLCDQGAIGQLIDILPRQDIVLSEHNAVDIEIQSDILIILSLICENHIHHKELYGQLGVRTIIKYLKLDPRQLSGIDQLKLLTFAVDNIWCCIVGCPLNEDYFLREEGMFLLLDLLEICPSSLQNIVLGTILELCDNRKAVSHLTTWRGSDNQLTIGSLLVKLWKQEEEGMGVQRDSNGVILDVKCPLVGMEQRERGVTSLPTEAFSPAIVDVFENMRSKIYGLFCKIGFNEVSGLTIRDSITVAIIEKYVDFKTGEIHNEIMEELQQETVRPITPDRECCEGIIRILEQRAKGVAMAQVELLRAEHGQDLVDEQGHYEQLKQNHHYGEKKKSNFDDFVKRTSDMSYLTISKEKQLRLIEESRVHHLQTVEEDANFYPEKIHDTDVPSRTTVLYGNQITADSVIVQQLSSDDIQRPSDTAMST